AAILRRVTSAILAGIIVGFSEAKLGDNQGWPTLADNDGQWAHVLGFLSATDLDYFDKAFPFTPWRAAVRDALYPLTLFLDRVAEGTAENVLLPSVVVYNRTPARLTITLRPMTTPSSRPF